MIKTMYREFKPKFKYRVTAYQLNLVWCYNKNNTCKLVHRWTKIQHWDVLNKTVATNIVRIWSKYRQPRFKVTMQSLRKEVK